ncbi:MAG: DUF262 domain-containing protein [Bacteroidales bacterium]|nr:DUF262 domain-containing protein [Bacteroidales bacterium]
MGFLAAEKPISEILTNNILGIPRNQRHYVWNKSNWEDLLSDINFTVKNANIQKHFIGSIVLKQEAAINGLDKFTIIDGQQRIITILLFLASIMKLFHENDMLDDFNGTKQYFISKDRKNIEYCVLNSESHIEIKDLIFKIINENNIISINKIISSIFVKDNNISSCIKFFYENLKNNCEKYEDKKFYLTSIRDALLDTNCVKITADTEEDSYTIFEILNARGQALADHELLKNYIMRYILPKDAVDEVKQKWEKLESSLGKHINKFFRHYATHKISATTKEKDQIYRILQKAFPKDKVSELMDDLLLKAQLYNKIVLPEKNDESKQDIEYKILKFFISKRAEQFRPIILSLMSKRLEGVLSNELYFQSLKFIYSFFVCYNIIGEEKSNKLEDVIYKYAPLLENKYNDEVLYDFFNSISRKTPSFITFKEKFKQLGWSNHQEFYSSSKDKDHVKIVLELIETHISKKEEVAKYSLEHILPDSDTDTNNALIGNIILLEQNLNENLKCKTLVEKIKIYKNSDFKIAREFAQRYENADFNPTVRAEHMAKLVYSSILKIDV